MIQKKKMHCEEIKVWCLVVLGVLEAVEGSGGNEVRAEGSGGCVEVGEGKEL